ncbi:MAG: AIR synthase-related protein [Syntrophus sp. (in: bacteria)]
MKFIQKPDRLFRSDREEKTAGRLRIEEDILFDPQTAGGLLLSVAPEQAVGLLDKFHRSGLKDAAIVGKVTGAKKGKIIVSL